MRRIADLIRNDSEMMKILKIVQTLPELFLKRMEQKQWPAKWPKLRVIDSI